MALTVEINDDRPGTVDETACLPSYAHELTAFHHAFTVELRAIIGALPLAPEMHVLDVGCGDGYYTALLAERINARGEVVALDMNSAYLELAQEHVAARGVTCGTRFVKGQLSDTTLTPGSFDLVWCAQSLYSLPDPIVALKQMRKLLRPGGLLVVLENDTLHQLLLPWPPQLEIMLRAAEFVSLKETSARPGKFYVGRRLPAVFAGAGLEPSGFKTQCIDRQAPLDLSLETFLGFYLKRLAERVGDNLASEWKDDFLRLVDPAGPGYLLRQPYFTLSWINVLAWGRRGLTTA